MDVTNDTHPNSEAARTYSAGVRAHPCAHTRAMLYSVQSLRYVKLVNRAIYDGVVAYMAMRDRLSHGNESRTQDAQQNALCVGDKLLKPLAWYCRKVECVDWHG